MSDFYGSRIAAFQQVKDSAFADLYFRSEVSGNPLVLKLRGQSLRMLRLSLSSPGMINLGSIRLVQPGATDPIELDGLARVDFSSQYLHETAAARGVTAFLRGKSTHASVHTRLEKRPWINIDLGKNHRIDKLLLNNRDDEWAGRSWGLRIDGKAEGRNFLPLYNHPQREIEFALRVGQVLAESAWPKEHCDALECLDLITLAILRGDYSDASDILTARRHLLSAEEAETIKHRVTQDLLHSRERFWITHGIVRSFAFWSTEEKVNYIREARSVLNVLHDMTDAACFGFGSALACQRDGDLIPHDDDLDIVVAFPKREVGSVQGGIQRIEQFLSQRGLVVSGDFKSHRKVRKKGNKPVDVFVGLIGEDMSVSWFPGPPDGLPYQEVFPPRRAELLGESFPVPARTETYLERVYGVDWRVPKARWSHNWNPGAHANLK